MTHPTNIPMVDMNIRIPRALRNDLNRLLVDPATGRRSYGALTKLIITLLQAYVIQHQTNMKGKPVNVGAHNEPATQAAAASVKHDGKNNYFVPD